MQRVQVENGNPFSLNVCL